jgi:hypothetical protein
VVTLLKKPSVCLTKSIDTRINIMKVPIDIVVFVNMVLPYFSTLIILRIINVVEHRDFFNMIIGACSMLFFVIMGLLWR